MWLGLHPAGPIKPFQDTSERPSSTLKAELRSKSVRVYPNPETDTTLARGSGTDTPNLKCIAKSRLQESCPCDESMARALTHRQIYEKVIDEPFLG